MTELSALLYQELPNNTTEDSARNDEIKKNLTHFLEKVYMPKIGGGFKPFTAPTHQTTSTQPGTNTSKATEAMISQL